jgi:energy-coupling factor transporter ATP-binding protein EcfA2
MDLLLPQGSKSISPGFQWLDIPEFAVVTGENGCGKTHLLQAMSTSLEGLLAPPNAKHAIGPRRNHPSGRVLYVPPYSAAGNITLPPSGSPFDPRLANLIAEHGRHFYDAYLQICEAKVKDDPIPENKPWEMVNVILEAAQVPCRLTDPERLKLGIRPQQFQPQIELLSRPGKFFQPSDLSPGEATILTLALWTFGASRTETQRNVIPRVVLLDEPDAHLHTSSIRRYLDVLRLQLVATHGLRIIITTHRPDTIALCPDESIFELHPSRHSPTGTPVETRIERTSRNRAISRLSGYLFAASPITRCVLVEDEDDVTFYRTLYESSPLDEDLPRLVFQPASTRRARGDKVPGGKTVVAGWVSKLCAASLSPLIQGIVDRDEGADARPGPGVHVIERYSIENYILDPIVVYASLLHDKGAPAVGTALSKEIRPGSEGNLVDLSETDLQAIANTIFDRVRPYLTEPLSDEEEVPVDIVFADGKKLAYPRWFTVRRGKNLTLSFREAFGSAGSDTKRLLEALEWIPMVPKEIATIFKNIATAVVD